MLPLSPSFSVPSTHLFFQFYEASLKLTILLPQPPAGRQQGRHPGRQQPYSDVSQSTSPIAGLRKVHSSNKEVSTRLLSVWYMEPWVLRGKERSSDA